jgi:hypothetical protein
MRYCSIHSLEIILPIVLLVAYIFFDVARTIRLAGRANAGRDKMGCLVISLTGSLVAIIVVFGMVTLSCLRHTTNSLVYYIVIMGITLLMKLHTESISALLGSPD